MRINENEIGVPDFLKRAALLEQRLELIEIVKRMDRAVHIYRWDKDGYQSVDKISVETALSEIEKERTPVDPSMHEFGFSVKMFCKGQEPELWVIPNG